MKIKKSNIKLMGLIILAALVSYVSAAGDPYGATVIVPIGGYNGFVNQDATYLLVYNTAYSWGVNITGRNITAVTINGLAMANASAAAPTGYASWILSSTPEDLGVAFQNNCTYSNVVVVVTSLNSTLSEFTNTTTQNNLTILPCIESSSSTSQAMAITDVNTSVLTLADSVASSTKLWMIGLDYNTSDDSCYYGCTNSDQCKVDLSNFLHTDNLTEYCVIEVNRSATDVGTVLVDVDQGINPAPVSNIPAAATAVLAVITITYIGIKRIKRRGSTKEA